MEKPTYKEVLLGIRRPCCQYCHEEGEHSECNKCERKHCQFFCCACDNSRDTVIKAGYELNPDARYDAASQMFCMCRWCDFVYYTFR